MRNTERIHIDHNDEVYSAFDELVLKFIKNNNIKIQENGAQA